MIVGSVRAHDILKYHRLELGGLPASGVFMVSGPNESGKSSIGEILALAFFGRTFALEPSELDKAIRWDALGGSVEVDFSSGEDGSHKVVRELDRDGLRSATLHTHDGAEIRGWEAVNDAVAALLGFGFSEYTESFYLARRDSISTRARTDAVRAMAGVLPLEQIAAELAAELPSIEASSLELADQLLEIDEQQARYSRDDLLPPQPGPAPGDQALVAEAAARKAALGSTLAGFEVQLPELQAATRELVSRAEDGSLEEWAASAERMETALDAIEESVAFLGYDDVEAGTGRLSHLLERITEGLDGFDTLTAAVMKRRAEIASLLGEAGSREAASNFDDQQADLDESRATARARRTRLSRGTAVAALAAVGCAVAGFLPIDGMDANVVLGLRIGAGVLAAVGAYLFTRQRAAVAELSRLGTADADLASRRDAAEDDAKLLDGFADQSLRQGYASLGNLRALGSLQASMQAFRDGAGGRLVRPDVAERLESGAEDQLAVLDAHFSQLSARIAADVEALGKIHELRQTRSRLAERRTAAARQLEVVELARELAAGASKQIAFDFNNRTKQALSRILPSLTEGRYQYLRIEDDLSVRVFSSEKQDFVTFEEISGGTQRQIALATRLALSETLADRADKGPQFVFLDEPFAYFDAQRTQSTLAAMPRLSARLPQVWIATQEPPPGTSSSVDLRCSVESRELSIGEA